MSAPRCHDCGTTEGVSTIEAPFVERETGYADSLSLCCACWDARDADLAGQPLPSAPADHIEKKAS